ncbi:hypothetical protein [Vannielia litorea]|uniref:Uncharacterized protein n=1 Tax=Vannielia litorea TaxID=1217970 RepID=A0A1N6EB45_9RHOB|nr:hypothetical protein [Vannielia litorea]SIN80216.1 hypothetical protein SAMN05444002_0537 [Vannielia litorea]
MHAKGTTETLDLFQAAASTPCFGTLAPLHARLVEITESLCDRFPQNARFPEMRETLCAAKAQLAEAEEAARLHDTPAFEDAKARLQVSLAALGQNELDLARWGIG